MSERFWLLVDVGDPDLCWPWLGARSAATGRGNFRTGGQHTARVTAPRAAFYLCHGYWPRYALHLPLDCDNPACCNPLHIYDGSAKDNTDDRDASGHTVVPKDQWGKNNPNYKHGRHSRVIYDD